ncbi:MAG: glucokinase [Alphaproteobacteria bacterium]|nr:glucokinase [Alphaproteobacteria bacterium]
MNILVDIGGTYARFAVEKAGQPAQIQKYAADAFETFEDALDAYVKEAGVTGKTPLRISTAAHPAGDTWQFVNRNKWVLDPAVLKKKGFPAEIILNDFEAATWGLLQLGDKDKILLKEGRANKDPLCLIGPGTGLGLGYLAPLQGGKYHVQKTMGGHLPAATVTAEQELVLQTIRRIKGRPGTVVYEDVVSGPGLFDIYNALCWIDETPQKADKIESMLENADDIQVRAAIRLFHEFFGIFAATVTVAANSYGGLYLMGGVVDRLAEKNLFDFPHFEKFFVADLVLSVRKALNETAVYRVTDPYLALKGLLAARA